MHTGGVAIGSGAYSSSGGTALGFYALANHQGAIAIAGTGYTTASTRRTRATGASSIAIGSPSSTGDGAVASGTASIAIGSNTSSGGPGPRAAGVHSIAIGIATTASQSYAIAIGQGTASGQYSIAMGISSSASNTNTVAIGPYASESIANAITIGGSTTYVASIGGYRAWTNRSDVRDKTDLMPVTKGIDFIKKLNPITYVDNDRDAYFPKPDEMDEEQLELYRKYGMINYDKQLHASGVLKGERRRAGLAAQEVYQALIDTYGSDNYADIVHINSYDDEESRPVEDKYTMTYTVLIPFLIQAIKEQQSIIEKMKFSLSMNGIIID